MANHGIFPKQTMSKMKDSQRSAVYKWEQNLFPVHYTPSENKALRISPDHAGRLKNQIWLSYHPDSKPPLLRSTSLAAAYATEELCISIPYWGWISPLICHEIAHSIINRWIKKIRIAPSSRHSRRLQAFDVAGHGPEFAMLLARIYSDWCNIEMFDAIRQGVDQRPRKVQFAKLINSPQPINNVIPDTNTDSIVSSVRNEQLAFGF